VTPADFLAQLTEPGRIIQILVAAAVAALAAYALTPYARAMVAHGSKPVVPAGPGGERDQMAELFSAMLTPTGNPDPAESKWLARWVPPMIAGVLGAYLAAITSAWAVALVLVAFVIGSSLLVATDQAAQRLPDKIVWPTTGAVAMLLVLAAIVTGAWGSLLTAGLGGLILGIAFFALAWFRPNDLGLGDVKLSVVIGLVLGWYGWIPLAVGAVSGFFLFAILGITLMVGRLTYSASQLAFGPWMILGAIVGITYGTFA